MYCFRIIIDTFLEVKKIQATPTKKDLVPLRGFFSKFFSSTSVLLVKVPAASLKRAIKQVHSNFLSGEILLTLQMVIHNRSYPPELRGVQSSRNHHSFSTWKWYTLALKIANDINISLLDLDD